jgi:hypothetical protein
MIHTFTLSIEPIEGPTFQYGFHLGTDLALAKKIVEEKFQARNDSSYVADLDGRTMRTRTMALIRNNKIVDVYDGQWASEWNPEM